MKNLIGKILILLFSFITLVNVVGCIPACIHDEYKEYPVFSFTENNEYKGKKYFCINEGFVSAKSDSYGRLWQAKTEYFNDIIGKVVSVFSYVPVYKHDELGEDCLGVKGCIYLAEGYTFLNDKDSIVSKIAMECIYGERYLMEKDVYPMDENLANGVLEGLQMKKIINNDINYPYSAHYKEYLLDQLGKETLYCSLDANVYFDNLEYFYLRTRIYVYVDNKVYIELNDAYYQVAEEYATIISDYVRAK